ncbi:hypothetical protein [Methylobacterium persicinum]|uniref:3',5'-cyclic-nucleotide phosphodiesterase n=1 Tax=Methylobacterium persicinum TaxID=374426 RepID=A0ABU0HQ57_9HYPH|nr:hypothetical protein [Methylobacterium persicinum]MDQ0444459.1 hypothetical protein [Methylobacterium persicinum]GJE39541.1 hypothetical protein KHHGKMAE_3624 [Methylobacterium persicinum]
MRLVPDQTLRSPRAVALVALTLMTLTAGPALAQRDDQGLQLGCADDYFRLCIGVDPNSPDADRCMTRNRARLSQKCRAAIGDYDRRTGSKSMQNE